MNHPETCICGGTGRVYDHVQDDTGTECSMHYATWTDTQNRIVKQVPVADADMPEVVTDDKPDLPGWTSYKFHVGVAHRPETTDSTDIYGNVWRNWHASASVIKRSAFIEGLITGLGVGVGITMMILAHWIK